ncbi:hypothetical protein GCM10023212_37140 [Luteolibacter yonseiensis]
MDSRDPSLPSAVPWDLDRQYYRIEKGRLHEAQVRFPQIVQIYVGLKEGKDFQIVIVTKGPCYVMKRSMFLEKFKGFKEIHSLNDYVALDGARD